MSIRYSFEEFDAAFAKMGKPTTHESVGIAPHGEGFKLAGTIRSGDRHEMLYKLLRSQKARGVSLTGALATCHAENKEKCNPPIERVELDVYLKRVWEQPDSPTYLESKQKQEETEGDSAEQHARRVHQFEVKERALREAKRNIDAEERGDAEPPPSTTLRSLLDEPDEPMPWCITDCQPEVSRVVLAAQFKAGKTTLVSNCVRSLVDGEPFLGVYSITPLAGSIAVLDFEMSKNQLRRWYRDQSIQRDDRVFIVAMRGQAAAFNILDKKTRSLWARGLAGGKVAYLVVDCLRPIMDALGLDEHRDAGTFLVALDALLVEAGIGCCLLVHHMGHSGERSRGDSRIRDWPDVEWRLVRKDDDPASPRYFTAYGRDVDVAEVELGYDGVTRRLTIVGGSRRDSRIEEAIKFVVSFVSIATEPPSRNDIVRGLKDSGHSQDTLKAAIRQAVEQGLLITEPGKRGAHLHKVVAAAESTQSKAAQLLNFGGLG
jgi:hypothetical protein